MIGLFLSGLWLDRSTLQDGGTSRTSNQALRVQEPLRGVVGNIHLFVFINGDTNTVIDIQFFSFEELKSADMKIAFEHES